ncbi:hypothetical protein JVT61DRAFT_1274 [Boletus reticuloceps]|uniref:Uncharacterized protein n=1 Tax=Boletus reticuloceps TaxID=495285 RepID=A0A8I2YS99_9AGAM|nr:hypothetical protein JVT61DRAFT_1274 [Boletus reticuloceps]
MAQRCDEVPRRLGNYWLRTRLGSGYSGSIFSAYHIFTGDWVAIKVQDINHECPTNRYEEYFIRCYKAQKACRVYSPLASKENGTTLSSLCLDQA